MKTLNQIGSVSLAGLLALGLGGCSLERPFRAFRTTAGDSSDAFSPESRPAPRLGECPSSSV